jgi:hypothetical protein
MQAVLPRGKPLGFMFMVINNDTLPVYCYVLIQTGLQHRPEESEREEMPGWK